MKANFTVTFLWTLAVTLSGVLSLLLTHAALRPKFGKAVTALAWAGAIGAGFGLALLSYSFDISDDTMAIIGISAIVWLSSVLLYKGTVSSKLFISIMATLIANVSTFFFCGTTLSFLDNTPNPYNQKTILIFIAIKLVWFSLFFILYRRFLCKTIVLVVETLEGKMRSFLPIPLVSFFGFYFINKITNHLGILPGVPAMRYIFIQFYFIICVIFVFEYWQIFSSVFWSSRALKTETELRVASNIQKDMLPCIFPAFPERREFDIYATMEPAKEVGGDFYDFFLVDDSHLAVVIADVSGKGVPAALFMVIAKTLIKNHTQLEKQPEEVFTAVNNQLCENNEEGMFVTAFMGILELNTGKFTYVNAGHNPPLIKKAGGRFKYLPLTSGFVLAGMENICYSQSELFLQRGDHIFLYTDGVTEATNNYGELFGEPRLYTTMNAGNEQSLETLLTTVKKEIDHFVGGADQFDDITMLAVAYKGGTTE